jgi:2'-hydroxyisoflavone reductase
MRVLFIGGTRFVGLHMAEAALARGHEVTLFNRGTNPDTPAGVELLTGDRDGGLDALRGRTWDAVIDTPGYVPRVVRQSAELLAEAVSRYVFISTLSAYASFEQPGMDESAPLARLDDAANETVTGETYGGLKARCEDAVREVYGDRALIVRPGYIVGPFDPTDRFTYWPVRAARGGEMLAPGSPDAPIQFIDARDLADFTIGLLESGATGAYNVTGPERPLTWGPFLEYCRRLTGGDTFLTWVDEDFLLTKQLGESGELPLWIASEWNGLHSVSIAKAVGAGLRTRPLGETINDLLEWRQAVDRPLAAGLDPEREAELLGSWHAGREQ